MKNWLNFFTGFLFICTIVVFSACDKDDDDTPEPTPNDPIALVLSASIPEGLTDPIIFYHDENGDEQTEALTGTSWEKTMSVSDGYEVYLKVTATIPVGVSGTAEISGAATRANPNLLWSQPQSQTFTNPSQDIPLSLKIEHTF